MNLAGGKYKNGKYEFEVDYTEGVKKVFADKLGNTNSVLDITKLKNITHTIEIVIPEHGKTKLSEKQVEIFHKINLSKAKSDKKKAIGQLEKEFNTFCDNFIDLTQKPPTWYQASKPRAKSRTTTLLNAADKFLETGTDQIEKSIANTLKQYVKGKVRRRIIIAQGVKHGVKPILGVAAIPVGIFLSASGFAAPVGIMATKAGIVSIKQSFDFFSGRYRSLDKLEASIISNTKFVQKKATAYAEKIEARNTSKTPEQRDKADKARAKIKAKIKVTEINAMALQEFFAIHKKSINNLSYVVGKYEKKVNELNYAAIKLGKKIDHCKAKTAKLEKENKKRKDSIKLLKKNPEKFNLSHSQAKKYIMDIENQLDKEKYGIAKLQYSIHVLDRTVDGKIGNFLERNAKFREWKTKLEEFNEIRPKSLKRWKRAIAALSLVESFFGTAVGGASDGIGGIEKKLEITVAVFGYTEDGFGKLTDLISRLKKFIKK